MRLGANPPERKPVAEDILRMKALAREAERRKVDQDPRVLAQLNAVRQRVLAGAIMQTMDEAGDKKYFDEHPDEFGQVKARHVLISTRNDPSNPKPALSDAEAKKKADEIRARLVKGEDFAKIVSTESDDPGSKNTGGEYTFPRGRMVPAFEQAAFALKINEISQPVKTPFGYHVIQLLQRLPGKFEESRQFVRQHRLEALAKELTGGAQPTFNESYFGEPAKSPVAETPASKKPAAGAGK